MANEQNLIRNSERTPKERREIARRGGIASGEAKRAKKAMKEVLSELLLLPLRDGQLSDDIKCFSQLAANQKNVTVEQAILIKQIAMAIQGSTKAATFIRDTAGQKILKDATENNTNYEDDGFIDAIHRSSKDVWK